MTDIYGRGLWGPPSPAVNDEFIEFIAREPTAAYEADWDYCMAEHPGSFADAATVGSGILGFVEAKVARGEPFSIIRLNDGEGTVLFPQAFPGHPNLGRYVTDRISEVLFGSPGTISDNLASFQSLLARAAATADVIGMPDRDFPDRRLDREKPEQVDVRAVCGVKAQLRWLRQGSDAHHIAGDAVFASAWLSKYLLPHYERICGLFPRVILVTGNAGLGAAVARAFRLPGVHEILVPTQRALKLGKGPQYVHFPERFNEVMDELAALAAGSLVLVAAGVLGKPYCAQVRQHGSSAIDIGHVADIWYGKVSRPGVSDDFVNRWTLM